MWPARVTAVRSDRHYAASTDAMKFAACFGGVVAITIQRSEEGNSSVRLYMDKSPT